MSFWVHYSPAAVDVGDLPKTSTGKVQKSLCAKANGFDLHWATAGIIRRQDEKENMTKRKHAPRRRSTLQISFCQIKPITKMSTIALRIRLTLTL